MFSMLSFKLAFLGYSIASALGLNLTTPISSPKAPNATTALTLLHNLQLGTKSNDLTIEPECNGPESGAELTLQSCDDVVKHGIPEVTDSMIIREYGDRSTGRFDVNLPQRYISGKSDFPSIKTYSIVDTPMGDGRCVVDVTLKDIQKPTRYHPVGLALSAAFVIATCVKDHDPEEGGTLEGFDARKNMRLVLHSYKPNVVCLTQTIAYDIRDSCQSLLDTMHISDTQIKFGYERDSTVRMPYTRVSADDMCVLEIGTSGVRSDIASWKDFWEIGVAINGMCIREGRQGFQINIGAAGGLRMELKNNWGPGGTLSSS